VEVLLISHRKGAEFAKDFFLFLFGERPERNKFNLCVLCVSAVIKKSAVVRLKIKIQ
jgi:hypothetical protein